MSEKRSGLTAHEPWFAVLVAVADAFEDDDCACCYAKYGEDALDEDCATHHYAVQQAVKMIQKARAAPAAPNATPGPSHE